MPIGLLTGVSLARGPEPHGTHAVNFSIFSRTATAISLVLARQPSVMGQRAKGVLEIALDPVVNRTGDLWHVCIPGLRSLDSLCWGWRADGDAGTRFQPGGDPSQPSSLLKAHNK